MFALIRSNPRFFRFWMSTWASELGDWIRNMTLTFTVIDLSHNSAVAVSTNWLCEFAPLFLFGSIVGVFADRWDRKKTVIGALLLRVAVMGLFVAAILTKQIWLIFVGAVLSAVCGLFFRAPGNAFQMQFVPMEDRGKAASLRQTSSSAMALVGAPIGTGLYMLIGGAWSLTLTAACFVIASLLVASIRVDGLPEAPKKQTTVLAVLGEMREGLRYSWNNKVVRPMLYSSAPFGFGGGLINVLEIFIVMEFLGLSDKMFALLASIQGTAMFLLSFVVGKIKMPYERMYSLGMVVMGIGLAGMVLYPNFGVTSAFLVLFSFGQIALSIAMATLMQTKVAYEYQGRTSMTLGSSIMFFMVIAYLTAGWLHEIFSLRSLIVGSGVFLGLGGLLTLEMYRRANQAEHQQNAAVVSGVEELETGV